MQGKAIYTLVELESITGVPRRRIRYWIEKRLVPHSYASERPGDWRQPLYGEEHLRRIKKLVKYRESQTTDADLAERLEAIGERALDVKDVYAHE